MRGHMSVGSTRGEGTRITLSVPLTVAVVDAFLVEGRTGLFAVPAGSVASVDLVERARLRPTLSGCFLAPEGGSEPAEGAGLIPVFDLDGMLGLEAAGSGHTEAAPLHEGPVPMLAYQLDGTRGALAVGKIIRRGDLVVRPLGPPLERLRKYSGVALLDDGSLALIVDLANLARSA
jgi:two-component system chemotaxis sensor kinase CheA